jgi:hypothetical protein
MPCFEPLIDLGCVEISTCDALSSKKFVSDALGIHEIFMSFNGMILVYKVDVLNIGDYIIDFTNKKWNENYNYIFWIKRPDGTQINNTFYKIKTKHLINI